MFPPPGMEEKFLTIPGQSCISSTLSVLLNNHFLYHGSYISWPHPHLTHLNLEDGGRRLLQNLCNHRQRHMLSPFRRQKSEQSHHVNTEHCDEQLILLAGYK